MRVFIDGEASEAVPVDSGVPQGTVLGSYYFFAIYMICIDKSSLGKTHLTHARSSKSRGMANDKGK